MEAKTVSKQTQDAQKRFFEAIDRLVDYGKLAGLQTFCDENGFHRAKYSNLRSGIRTPGHVSKYKLVDVDALICLVSKYGVRADWLLTGRGEMFP